MILGIFFPFFFFSGQYSRKSTTLELTGGKSGLQRKRKRLLNATAVNVYSRVFPVTIKFPPRNRMLRLNGSLYRCFTTENSTFSSDPTSAHNLLFIPIPPSVPGEPLLFSSRCQAFACTRAPLICTNERNERAMRCFHFVLFFSLSLFFCFFFSPNHRPTIILSQGLHYVFQEEEEKEKKKKYSSPSGISFILAPLVFSQRSA